MDTAFARVSAPKVAPGGGKPTPPASLPGVASERKLPSGSMLIPSNPRSNGASAPAAVPAPGEISPIVNQKSGGIPGDPQGGGRKRPNTASVRHASAGGEREQGSKQETESVRHSF